MMTPMEFYCAITPDCGLQHGVGAEAHVDVTETEVATGKYYQGPTLKWRHSLLSISPQKSIPL